jgi:phosphoenolpyruvate carboxylase
LGAAPFCLTKLYQWIKQDSLALKGGWSRSTFLFRSSDFDRCEQYLFIINDFNKVISMSNLQTQLRDNIRLLGSILGDTIRSQLGDALYHRVEEIRDKAIGSQSSQDWTSLVELMGKLSDDELVPVARAFTHFLNYANIAEQHHQVRCGRNQLRNESGEALLGTLDELLPRLLKQGVKADDLAQAMSSMQVELVLTAHPTEVTRRTLRRKYNEISDILSDLDSSDITPPFEQRQLKRLRRRILASWHTDEIRRQKPTPIDEAKWGYAAIEESLWTALPNFLVKFDELLYQHTGQRLPLSATPIRFTSWMGGDRDGNPNVTASVTQHVLTLGRWQAAHLLFNDISELRQDLSFGECNQALRDRVGAHREPYRELLRGVRQRLENTRDWAEAKVNASASSTYEAKHADIYQFDDELLEPLQLIYDSLLECGLGDIAEGSLSTIMRRVACFGLTLLKLDIRQDSALHRDTISEVTDYLGIQLNGVSYKDWSEADKQTFLLAEIESLRPLIPTDFPATEQTREVLDTFSILADQPASALGAYIISMATYPSDVLAVRLLQKEMGCKNPQRIVPLFETLSDLEGAAETMNRLLEIDQYKQSINGQQEVMIGYSDSAKDAGFFAASWGQYRAQESLSQICQKHGVHLTLFHGRGGSASRGGGPAHTALLSQPPGTIKGSVRVTEQGEMIQFKFGLHDLALENLEMYTAGTLEATLAPASPPKKEWRNTMQQLADISVQEYRRIVHHDSRFVPYFRQVTPEMELRRLALGSRPAKRHASGGVESLRAIPWVFAWTQMRFMLPAWLGTGKALMDLLEGDQHSNQQTILQDMHKNWTFFNMLIDMQEMVLAKVDSRVAAYYEQRLLSQSPEQDELIGLGDELRESLEQATQAIQKICGHTLLENNPLLRETLQRRNPYIYPLHITQVELMHRLRLLEEGKDPLLEQGLMVSIAGIAAGLRNTG